MNTLHFNNSQIRRDRKDALSGLGDASSPLSADIEYFPIILQSDNHLEEEGGTMAKVISGLTLAMVIPTFEWKRIGLTFIFSAIMWLTGSINESSVKRRRERINDKAERFGLFIGENFIAWRDLDCFHFIPKGVEFSVDKHNGFIVLNYSLKQNSVRKQLKIHTSKNQTQIYTKLKTWRSQSSERQSSEEQKQDLLDMSNWVEFLQKVQIYQDWLPEKLLQAMPSLPCSQQDLINFATQFRDYETHFKTRDRVIRSLFGGSILLSMSVAWLPTLNLFKATDGWAIMSILGSAGILISLLCYMVAFERSKDADHIVKHLLISLLCTFFMAAFMI